MSKILFFLLLLTAPLHAYDQSLEPFFERLEMRAQNTGSYICISINPHRGKLSEGSARGLKMYCEKLLKATSPHVLCYTIRIAFFESFGPEGMQVMQQLIEKIDPEIPVILDTKSGDIAACANALKEAYFDHYRVDAVTLNPLLGTDSIDPFLSNPFKGVFLVTKTSNPSGDEILNLPVGVGKQTPLYLLLAKRFQSHPLNKQMGLVVGVKDIEAIVKIRREAPKMWILTQGQFSSDEELQKVLKSSLREDGKGVILTLSESYFQGKDLATEIQKCKENINGLLDEVIKGRPFRGKNHLYREVACGLIENNCVEFGNFNLDNGEISEVYINLRKVISNPKLMDLIANLYLKEMKNIEFDRIAALPYVGLPIATAIALKGKIPMIFTRKEKRKYSNREMVEGIYQKGDQVLLVDDALTTKGVSDETLIEFKKRQLKVKGMIVLLDREEGGAEVLRDKGLELHAIFKLSELVDFWAKEGLIHPQNPIQTIEYLKNRKKNHV